MIFCNTITAIAINDREIKLVIIGIEFHEQFQHFIFHFRYTGVRFIDFVDDDNGLQLLFQSLAQDELRLRHRTFKSIDEQQNAVDHVQDTFDFAAEISMPRGVDDVDLVALVRDRAVLRINGDASFTLQIIAVHDAINNLFIVLEHMALLQKRIDQRGLSGVNVRDYSDIDNLLIFHRTPT